MSVLESIPNIKVPYASEGVIRTAQLDDTVAPENSVQLAVNMNFDRVGAIQTRPGITEYADDLDDPITNYGTLVNDVQQDGYVALAQLGLQNDMTFLGNSVALGLLDDTHVLIMYTESTAGKGGARIGTYDSTDGTFTVGSQLLFEAVADSWNLNFLLSTGRMVGIWVDASNDGRAQCFVNTGGTPALVGSSLAFDAGTVSYPAAVKIDATHFVVFYASPTGKAKMIQDDGSGNLSVLGAGLTFDAGSPAYVNVVLLDATHVLAQWWNGTNVKAQVFSVNTGTGAITAVGTPYVGSSFSAVNVISPQGSTHVVSFAQTATGITAQTLQADGSYNLTAVGTPVIILASTATWLNAVQMDTNHTFLTVQQATPIESFVQLVERDVSTQTVTANVTAVSGLSITHQNPMSTILIDSETAMVGWRTNASAELQEAMFRAIGPFVEGKYLYAGSGTSVYNTPSPGGVWTARRTGLATVSKPRFAQYLNYIWMVNGNDIIGGDPVATSSGGAFGTDLVPTGFPQGDFINAGFEGRVWVANKTLGVIYYTDIVQFVPPTTYSLTYNGEVNFISTLAPQTGETFTALFEVPRALLVFTENTITRIYGASSVDAYAAYNVGTYSQESIVKTKTGIFFHHSSGFYQFDYGSQPVEVSRRIIDFVKAIPRANYDDIVGIYDDFDCVKWYVGSVLVEGVTFRNCMVRYTISTQVWTIYDYRGIDITALISFDDGVALNQVVGATVTSDPDDLYKTGALDTGLTDYGEPFYYEFIDRWRAYTKMYYLTKQISGVNVYSENAAGANLLYQKQKSGPNEWIPVGPVTEANNAVMPNSETEDFDVIRWRLVGTTKGAPVVVHGIEITQLTIKGQEQN